MLGAGVTYGVQVAANISQNGLNVQAFTRVNWKAVAAGTVAGAVGGATFGLGTAVLGTGAAGTIASGAISGAVAAQAAIATENALTGQAITEGLGRPEDILRDAAVGAVVSGVGRSMDLALIRARYPGYYSRYISEGELQAIEETGLLRGGRPDETYFSLQTYTSRLRKPLLV